MPKLPLSVATQHWSPSVLVDQHGRSVCESKRTDAGTPAPAPVATARCITIFHDMEACPLSAEVDVMETMNNVFVALAGSSSNGRRLNVDAQKLARDWRLYKRVNSTSCTLSAEQVEHFADLGFSCLTVGRKPDATASKLRDDVAHFIESHSDPKQHAVVLVVDNASQFSNEFRALLRAGFLTFVITAQVPAPVAQSPARFQLLRKTTSTGYSHAAYWCDVLAKTVKSEAAGLETSEASTAQTTTPRAPSKSLKVMPMTPRMTRTVPEAAEEPKFNDEEASSPPSSSLSSKPSSPEQSPDVTTKPSIPQPAAPVSREVSHGGSSSSDPYRIVFGHLEVWHPDSGYAEKAASNTPSPPAAATNNSSGPEADDEQYGFRITEFNSPNAVHLIAPDERDFDYAWVARCAREKVQEPLLVCCRLHESGVVSDIRLCGSVERVVRHSYGFISHPLYPTNLYFRTSDVDNTGNHGAGSSRSTSRWQRGVDHNKASRSDCSLRTGDCVAFRVGQKGERVWALRVWKVPMSVARFIADSAAKEAGSRAATPRASKTHFAPAGGGYESATHQGASAPENHSDLAAASPKSFSRRHSHVGDKLHVCVLAGISNSPRARAFAANKHPAAYSPMLRDSLNSPRMHSRSCSPQRSMYTPRSAGRIWAMRDTATSVANSVLGRQF